MSAHAQARRVWFNSAQKPTSQGELVVYQVNCRCAIAGQERSEIFSKDETGS